MTHKFVHGPEGRPPTQDEAHAMGEALWDALQQDRGAAPEDTAERDPAVHVAGSMGAGGFAGYVTGMEADGQRQIVASDVLPADAPWGELEDLGFVRTDRPAGDDLFVNCTLPPGWKREAGEDPRWSYVVDERGVRRVTVFYKAAFYDRRAHAGILNVGAALGTEAIYGDGEPALPAAWDVLTDRERQDFRTDLTGYLDRARECPQVYGDRVPRVERLRELAAG